MNEEQTSESHSHADDSRRQFIKKMATGAAALTLLGAVSGCSQDEPEMLVGTLEEFETSGALSPKFNGNRILVTKRNEKLVIFSLVCSHKACTVKWKGDKDQFACPCHKGKYDREGNVIDGPPPAPLRRYQHQMRGNEIWVLNTFTA